MKHQLHFRRFFATLMLLAITTLTWAYDFEANGIYYYKNSDGTSVTVTYKTSFYNSYSGSVTIPSQVTYNSKTYNVISIATCAFADCSGLTLVTIPNSVTSIGGSAFSGCSGLTSITIPNSVTSIGNYAFYKCSGLTSVTIGNGVTSIGSDAFYNCSGLTSVTIGNSVRSIGNSAFSGCSGLTSVTLNANDIVSKTYNPSGSNLGTIFGTQVKEYVLGDDVKGIGSYAFEGCSGLTSITIPNSVTSIGDGAFYNCTGLTSVTIPNSVTRIGYDAFSGCSGLTKTEFASIDSLCKIAFVNYASNPLYYAHHLYINGQEVKDLVIPNSVTSISSSTFSGCTSLTSVTIPNSVKSIGNQAFYRCSGLTSVTLNANDIVSKTYSSSSNLGTIFGSQVKEYVLGDDLKGIGNYAFYKCSGLTSVTIPNSVTNIGQYAFSGCSGLTSVTIPNSVTSIGSYAFRDCSGLTSVTIPNSVKSIGQYAFSGCSGLTSVTIPNSVKSIGQYAFSGCSGLTSVTIPNSVTSIGEYAFSGCSGLTSVSIPNSVTSIGQYAFSGCSALTSVTIGNSVTSIGDYAFSGCSGLTSVTLNANDIVSKTYSSTSNLGTIFGSQVKEYVLGDDLKGIGNAAFYACSSLTSVTIPNSVTSIGNAAFSGCSGLSSVTLNANDIVSKTYTSYSNLGTIFGTQVKEYVLGDDVKGIGNYAFYKCSGLTSVTIPNSVTSIGGSAFDGTAWFNNQPDGLVYAGKVAYKYKGTMPTGTHITIEEGTSEITAHAFSGCSGLTSITIPNSVTSIGESAFNNCSGLTKAEFASIESLCKIKFGNFASNPLYYTHNLYINGQEVKDLVIPNSVTSIGEYAFYDCSGLTSVTIGNSVTSIGSSAFYGCSGLTSIDIPNSVTSIGSSAFYGCSGLTSIDIPNSVTSIGSSAFYGCSGLEEVILNSNSIVSKTYTSTRNISTIFGSQVKKYIFGDNITGIGEYAFPSNTSIYVSAKSSLLAAWNYGISPYDLKTSVLLANPLPTVQTNTASSIHVSRNSSAEESGIIIISSESITVAGVTITKIGHTTKFTGLTPNTAYTVAYNSTIKYAGSTFSYSNEYRATTNALTLTTSQPKVISAGNVVVGAVSNLDDAEENAGFEWRRTDWTDDFKSNTGVAYLYEGTMEGYIRNLYTEKLWKVRPYYKSNSGNLYYGDWVGIDPTNTSYFEPTVHTYARIDQTENKVQISGYVQRGTDDVSKQGFKYWEQEDNARGAGISIPSGAKTVEADGRVMEVELTGLKPNTTYAYVAFVTTTEGETFYGKQLSFTTGDDPEASVTGDANGNGVVEIGDVTSVLTLMATPEATGYDNKAADANGNGVIEIGDVTTILTIMAGN